MVDEQLYAPTFLPREETRDEPHLFFSSRRRHTRWPRDWSSDVCSSDLGISVDRDLEGSNRRASSGNLRTAGPAARDEDTAHQNEGSRKQNLANPLPSGPTPGDGQPSYEIGRASCRERV